MSATGAPHVIDEASPFNLLEYITHLKNHSGPTARNLGGGVDDFEGGAMAGHFCSLAGRNRTALCIKREKLRAANGG